MNNSLTAESITPKMVSILIGIIIIALVLIPILNSTMQDTREIHQTNEGSVGADLSLFNAGTTKNYTVEVTKDGSAIVLTGDYSTSYDIAMNSVIMLANSQALYTDNGKLYYTDGQRTTEVDSYTLTLDSTHLNGQPYQWVYFPETNGAYASYTNGYDYNLSGNIIAMGTYAGVTVISKDSTVTSNDTVAPIDTVTIHTDNEKTTGVTYSQ